MNCVVIRASCRSPFATTPLAGGESSLQRVVSYARALSNADSILVLADGPVDAGAGVTVEARESWSLQDTLRFLHGLSDDYQHVFFVWADTPLLDAELSTGMFTNHLRYFAEYSFAEGYPAGIAPEILDLRIVPALLRIAGDEDCPMERGSLFELIQKEINSFDLETEISPVDLRMLRASLSCDTKRNTMLVERVLSAGGKEAGGVIRVLQQKPEVLRTLPAYVPVQVIGGCPQACSYCPFPAFGTNILKNRDEMSLDDFETILDKVAGFSGDAVIGLSLWGEPALHSRITRFVEAVARRPGLSLVVETSGVGWQDGVLNDIHERVGSFPEWIVSLDAVEPALYEKLRGRGYDEAKRTAERLLELVPERVHVQAVRMQENEPALEQFFRTWKERTEKVIIQKYDHFCGFLPERKVTDLSPLSRFPCRHVKRDLPVLLNGSVPLCREDLRGEYTLGNLLTQPIEDVWHHGEPYYRRHITEDYPALCKGCDEYYTYNF